MDLFFVNKLIHTWFASITNNEHICNRWCTAIELYNHFEIFNSPSDDPMSIVSYQSFLKQFNIIQTNNKNIRKEISRSNGNTRIYKYFISYDIVVIKHKNHHIRRLPHINIFPSQSSHKSRRQTNTNR